MLPSFVEYVLNLESLKFLGKFHF